MFIQQLNKIKLLFLFVSVGDLIHCAHINRPKELYDLVIEAQKFLICVAFAKVYKNNNSLNAPKNRPNNQTSLFVREVIAFAEQHVISGGNLNNYRDNVLSLKNANKQDDREQYYACEEYLNELVSLLDNENRNIIQYKNTINKLADIKKKNPFTEEKSLEQELPTQTQQNTLSSDGDQAFLNQKQDFIKEYILLHNTYEPTNGNTNRRKTYKGLKNKILLKYHPDKYIEPDQKKQVENLYKLLNDLIQEIEKPKDNIFTFPDTLMPQIYDGLKSPLYTFNLYAGAITGAICASRTLSAFNEVFNLGDNNQAVKTSLKASLNNLDEVFNQMTQSQQKHYLKQKQYLVSILK